MFSRLSILAWLIPYDALIHTGTSNPAREIRYLKNMFLTLLMAKQFDLLHSLERKLSGMVIAGRGI